MPSFVSHIELSKDVSDKLCFDNVLTRYASTYSLGGDLCRFSKCRRLSHRKKKEEFIFNMINYIKENKLTDNKEVMGILYGHISHYIMDDTMHPLVRLIDKESSPVRMKSHTLIEGMIDSYIVKYKYNMEILDILKKYLTTYKDIRFSQALYNLNIISDDTKDYFYYTEPKHILRRIKEK